MGLLDVTGIGAIADFASKVIDKVFPDPAQAANAKIELLKLQQSGELAELAASTQLAQGQLDVNKIEAASTDKFTSRWRPFIGWVCGSAFAYTYLGQPLLVFIAISINPHFVVSSLPALSIGDLMPVLLGLLGLGYMRTQEKIAGVATHG